MQSMMKQIAISNGHPQPIFSHSTELWKFQNRLGSRPREDVTALTLYGFQLSAWNLVRWCEVPWSKSLLEMVMLGQFLGVSRNFEIFDDRRGPGRWNWGNHITAWNLVKWCNLPWSGSLYEMSTLSLCSHFLILAGQGCYHSLKVLFKHKSPNLVRM